MNYNNNKDTGPKDYKKKKKVDKPKEMAYAPLAKKKIVKRELTTRPGDRVIKKMKKVKGKTKTKTSTRGKSGLINKSSLNASIKKRMMNHAQNHTTKHLSYMIGKIENGKNFSEAHLLAQKALGK